MRKVLRSTTTILTSLSLIMPSAMPGFAAGDVAKGEKTFKKCKACHVIANGDDVIYKGGKTGPNLYDVIGRTAGTAEGFKYKKSIVAAGEAGLVWDEQNLAEYVQDPAGFLKAYLDDPKAKSGMTFKLKKGAEDVAAFLASVSPSAPATAAPAAAVEAGAEAEVATPEAAPEAAPEAGAEVEAEVEAEATAPEAAPETAAPEAPVVEPELDPEAAPAEEGADAGVPMQDETGSGGAAAADTGDAAGDAPADVGAAGAANAAADAPAAETPADPATDAPADAPAEAQVDAQADTQADAQAAPQTDTDANTDANTEAAAEGATPEAEVSPETAETDAAETDAAPQAEDETTADAGAETEAPAADVTAEDEAALAAALEAASAEGDAEATAATEGDAAAAAETAETDPETDAETDTQADNQADAQTDAPTDAPVDAPVDAPATGADGDGAAVADAEGQSAEPETPEMAVPTEAMTGEAQVVAAAEAGDDASAEAEVVEEVVTEETTRSSSEDFENAVNETAAPQPSTEATEDTASQDTAAQEDGGLSKGEKALLLGLGAAAVGAILSGDREVKLNSGDRVVVAGRDGTYQILKDDNALLRQPGSTVRTQSFSDGSTRTVVERPDGTQIVTIRDKEYRVLRRVHIAADGSETVLIDDTVAVEPVDVTQLPEPAKVVQVEADETEEALRAALAAEAGFDRSFSLTQIRNIAQVRALVPVIDLDNITFETGSAAIKPDQARSLAQLGKVIKSYVSENPSEVFLIEGHTDAVGSAAYNLALSDRRAESVALALTEYFEVPPENLVVQGYGEAYLKVKTLDEERANRRASVRRITELLRQVAAN